VKLLLVKYLTLFAGLLTGINCYSQSFVNGLVKDVDTDDPVPFAVIIDMNLNKAYTR
jgi:hypothetical protein